MFRKSPLKLRNKLIKGQISVLIVFSLIPMFTLFAFVINVGMMVHAKIALQNAADFAAYAGAATQARQLTNISHLNYQMRQVYKKFLFKYYVLGNLSLRCFPKDGSSGNGCVEQPVFDWLNRERNSGAPGEFAGMPVVCLSLSAQSNACQLARPVPVVKPPDCIPLDPTCAVLKEAALKIANIQNVSCSANSVINTEVLSHWLYATDPNATINSNVNLQGLIDDFGLLTEELLLKSRIDVVKSYINEPPQAGLTMSKIKSQHEGYEDQGRAERTILAFKSAYNNLNKEVFNEETIEMSELIPRGTELLRLKTIQPTFSVAYTVMQSANPNPNPNQPDDCQISVQLYDKVSPIVGVYKEPSSYVYYAVKLSAKARLLFNPFPSRNPADEIQLTAYAAAAPFGSRIGPALNESDFVKTFSNIPVTNLSSRQIVRQDVVGPWLSILSDKTKTWDSTDILRAYHRVLAGSNSNSQASSIGKNQIMRGIYAATLPDEIEVGKYNIPVDTDRIARGNAKDDKHEMMPYYRHSNESAGTPFGEPANYTFWAPVSKIGQRAEFRDRMFEELDKIAAYASQASTSTFGAARLKLQGLLRDGLDRTFTFLQQRQNYNIARIPDPLAKLNFQGNYPPIPGKITEPTRLATSYTTDHDYEYYQNGRDGYSVKFIPFRKLLAQPGRLTNLPTEKKWPVIDDSLFNERSELLKALH